jgi:SOS-response transcriptional repressor LexA
MADGSKKIAKKARAAPEGLWVNGKFVKDAFMLRVRGDSMVDPAGGLLSFPPDCYISVDPNREAKPGSPVLVEFKDGLTGLKMLEVNGAQKWLMPLNPTYVPSCMPDDARILGVVVSVMVSTLTEAGERRKAEGAAHV